MAVLVALGATFFVVAIAAVVLAVYSLQSQKSAAVSERLNQFTESTMSLDELELQQPFHQRVLMPLMQSVLNWLGKLGPKQNAELLRRNLQLAGNPGNMTPSMYVGMRVGLGLFLLVLFGFVTGWSLLYTPLGGAIGYLMPGMWLRSQTNKRKKNILKALPDALDLLTISVEAGLGFDVALQRVTEKWDDELSREFKRALGDVRLGRARRDALRDMAERTGVDDVQTFVAAIIQAEQLGVAMSKILRLQSDQMRVRRRQRAEAEAQRAPIKMLFPMVFLIFPALFVVILGPAVPRIMQSLGGI